MWSRQVVTLKQQQAKCELAGCHTGWESSGEIQPGSCHALDFIDLGDIQLPPEQPQPGPFPCHTIWSTETPDFLVSRPYKKQHSFSCLLCARPSHPLLPLLSPFIIRLFVRMFSSFFIYSLGRNLLSNIFLINFPFPCLWFLIFYFLIVSWDEKFLILLNFNLSFIVCGDLGGVSDLRNSC